MTKWNVVLSYDVQKFFTVEADSYEEANKKAYEWDYIDVDEDWEFRDNIETTKIEEERINKND
tara:strand:+ start:313 stop:501 length:189 start_codon:yes stop_codon:yes gene_type:complete